MPPQNQHSSDGGGRNSSSGVSGDSSQKKTHIYYGPVSGAAPTGVAAVSEFTGEIDARSIEIESTIKKHQEILNRLEIEKKASNLRAAVPTDDRIVRKLLRAVGHPICLFGEGPFDRRQRLKLLIAQDEKLLLSDEVQKLLLSLPDKKSISLAANKLPPLLPTPGSSSSSSLQKKEAEEDEDLPHNELFYTEGPDDLVKARRLIFEDSVRRSEKRLQLEQKLKRELTKITSSSSSSSSSSSGSVSRGGGSVKQQGGLIQLSSSSSLPPSNSLLRAFYHFGFYVQNHMHVTASQVGSDRPLTCCRFSPGSSRFSSSSSSSCVYTGEEKSSLLPTLVRVKKERLGDGVDHREDLADEEDEDNQNQKRQRTLSTGGREEETYAAVSSSSLNDLKKRSLEDPRKEQEEEEERLWSSWESHPKYLATSSWSEEVKLWNVKTGDLIYELKGHKERVHGLAWREFDEALHADPISGGSSAEPFLLASGGADACICLWDVNKLKEVLPEKGETSSSSSSASSSLMRNKSSTVMVGKLEGHEDRVNRLAFHPLGKFLASTSHDETWRLWDIETQQELLLQEGHAAAVYGLSIHPDGSLIVTTDLSGVVRVSDLRTGRTVMPLIGHVRQVSSASFHPVFGNLVATASDDHSVKLWDLRKPGKHIMSSSEGMSTASGNKTTAGGGLKVKNSNVVTSVLAHNKMITEVLFEPIYGRCMYTSSFDGLIKVWSVNDFACIKTLPGHEGRVMSIDVMKGGETIASVGFDRTWKLWNCKPSTFHLSKTASSSSSSHLFHAKKEEVVSS